MPPEKWKTLSSETAFKNRWWDIVRETVELPDGARLDDFFVNHAPGGAVAFAVTEEGNVVLNRQYKHGVREIVEELAIGWIDPADPDPLAAAKRELLEETGYGGGEWEPLGVFLSNPTSSTARLHAFLARGVRKLREPARDPREAVEVTEVAPEELLRRVREGRVATTASVAVTFRAFERLGWLKTSL